MLILVKSIAKIRLLLSVFQTLTAGVIHVVQIPSVSKNLPPLTDVTVTQALADCYVMLVSIIVIFI